MLNGTVGHPRPDEHSKCLLKCVLGGKKQLLDLAKHGATAAGQTASANLCGTALFQEAVAEPHEGLLVMCGKKSALEWARAYAHRLGVLVVEET